MKALHPYGVLPALAPRLFRCAGESNADEPELTTHPSTSMTRSRLPLRGCSGDQTVDERLVVDHGVDVPGSRYRLWTIWGPEPIVALDRGSAMPSAMSARFFSFRWTERMPM